jgi:DNA polymerase III alpha subunit
MKQNKFSELVFSESDLCDLVMQGVDVQDLANTVIDKSVDVGRWPAHLQQLFNFHSETSDAVDPEIFHQQQQQNWHMPEQYKTLDIASHVLNLCNNEAELQRCGAELLLYQERNMFDLLRYLKYLVDVMTANQIIWGMGRGSSVASYVLYKLGVHRIDSLYYNLDLREFLR